MMQERFYLHVPFDQKDKAKALGARWDYEMKAWYAPSLEILEACHHWPTVSELKPRPLDTARIRRENERYNARVKPITGERYFVLDCDCPPWVPCPRCLSSVEQTGWAHVD